MFLRSWLVQKSDDRQVLSEARMPDTLTATGQTCGHGRVSIMAMIETCTFEIINVACLFAFCPLRLPVHYGLRPRVRRRWQDLQQRLQGGLCRG